MNAVSRAFFGVLSVGVLIPIFLTSFVLPDYAFSTDDPEAFLDFLWAIKRVSLFAGFAVVLVFIVLLFAVDIVPREKRALWLVVLILGHMAVTPFFWYFYLRSSK